MPLRFIEKGNTMNAAVAINAYTNIKNQTLSAEDIGYNVVSTALHRLEANLHLLFASINVNERSKAFEQALVMIYFLQKGLNFSNNDDLAPQLFRLYEFCRIKVLEIGISGSQNNVEIKQCHSFILEIVRSWDTIKTS